MEMKICNIFAPATKIITKPIVPTINAVLKSGWITMNAMIVPTAIMHGRNPLYRFFIRIFISSK